MLFKSPKYSNFLSSPTRCLAVAAALALGACATPAANTSEDVVKQRGNARWVYLVASDFTKAYNYNTPSFRAVVSPETYRGRLGVGVVWVGGEVTDVNCPEAAICLAKVRIDFKPLLRGKLGEKFSTFADETWLLEDGQWWIFEPLQGN